MARIYLASGWFNENQERRVKEAEEVLRGLGHEVFSPREHQNAHLKFGSIEWRTETFNNDVIHVDTCDVIFAIYDEEDAGTMWELGYAYAKDKTLMVFHEGNDIANLMITDSLFAYFKTWEEVKSFDIDNPSFKPYEGEVI